MMKNSEQFLDAFKSIEDYLRKITRKLPTATFYELVDAAKDKNKIVRTYDTDLRKLGDLRNAVVHMKGGNEFAIAEPNDWAVERIRNIQSSLLNPPKVEQQRVRLKNLLLQL